MKRCRIGALRSQHDIKSESVDSVYQECWNSPSCTHRLIPASDGLETSKEEGEWSMPGKGTEGGNSLPPGGQCKSYKVKAQLPEAQFGGVYTAAAAEGELESRVGVSIWRRCLHMKDSGPDDAIHYTSLSEPPTVEWV